MTASVSTSRTARRSGSSANSGCGKSVTALSIIRLLDKGTGRIVGGEILYRGRNPASGGEEEMRRIRGNEISMIFQEPMTSLNPVMTVGDQIAETRAGASARRPACGARARHRDASPRQDPRAAKARAQLPARVFRRSAPAGDDRHGAGLHAEALDRRRADYGARRHDSGADPGADRRTSAAARHGRPSHHARSRRGRRAGGCSGGDVCRQDRRAGRT